MAKIEPEEFARLAEEMMLEKFKNKYARELSIEELEELISIRKILKNSKYSKEN